MIAKAELADKLQGQMNKRTDLYITEIGSEGNKKVVSKIEEFVLKQIDKNKLFDYLREMEFNRLLSLAISTYGEPDLPSNLSNDNKIKKINNKNYLLISNEDEIDKWINE